MFTLKIAAWWVSIDASPALLSLFAQRYGTFASLPTPDAMQLSVTVANTPATVVQNLYHPKVTLLGQVFEIVAGHFQASIDLLTKNVNVLVWSEPVAAVEYTLRVWTAWRALLAGGMLLHTAAVVRAGHAYLFCGASGSGKTTVSGFSRDLGYTVLNDDLVVLLPNAFGLYVYATPFWNPTQVLPTPADAPLAAAYRLVQAPYTATAHVPKGRAMAELLACVPVLATFPTFFMNIWTFFDDFQKKYPLQFLYFTKDNGFWNVIDNAINIK